MLNSILICHSALHDNPHLHLSTFCHNVVIIIKESALISHKNFRGCSFVMLLLFRILDSKCHIIVTADGVMRGPKPIKLKQITDDVSDPESITSCNVRVRDKAQKEAGRQTQA